MSGEIFQPMENPDEPLLPSPRNPLLCYLCNEPYEEPCIFGCFHSFCAHCLRGRASEGKISCPLCGYLHTLKDGSSLPPPDLLLKFMIESSTEERAQCANCDATAVQMFFCNTCMQPLCTKCREETHRAKMFSSHDMVLLTKRAREVHKKCSLYEESYIMFSAEKKIMLCINCFRDMRIESRGHCLDLETAYTQSFKKLDLRVQAFCELQNSVREGILLFKALLEEIKTNSSKERAAIEELYVNLLERLAETKAMVLQKVDSQYSEKEATFRSQLKSLSALLPTLHVHLVIASAFRGSATKFEFLDFANVLMERLKSIVQKQHPIHPTQSGQIDTAYKTEFFKSLEPLLYVPMQRCTLATAGSNGVNGVHTGTSCPGSPVINRLTPNHTRRANGLNGAKVKFIDAKGQFAEHCREFENAHRDLLQRFEHMKVQCQELQRDLTMRRCLAKKDEVMTLAGSIETIQNNLDSHYNILEQKLPLLEKHWEESLERLNNEQDLYQAQIQDVMRLKQESQHLRVIASQLTSFVSSIAAVTERLAPKLGQSNQSSEQDQQMANLLEEINSVQPDSQQRVHAIRDAEEERQTILASRTNPLDSELIKTKGLLRAPSLRDKKGERRKRLEKENLEASNQEFATSKTSPSSSVDLEVRDLSKLDAVSPLVTNCELVEGDPAGIYSSGSDTFKIKLDTLCSHQAPGCDDKWVENGPVKICTDAHSDPPADEVQDGQTEISYKEPKASKDGDKLVKNATHDVAKSSGSKVPLPFKPHQAQIEERKLKKTREGMQRREESVSPKVDGTDIRNLLKDVENFSKRESLATPKKIEVTSNGDRS
ncbi:unnamed protein product [Lymnaea stagnalis]|uniref:RING finger protein 207 n=1 Tax=Lymnaea stagnalis TaxID=6523 RepID=A0AAV2HBJ4_LYMST